MANDAVPVLIRVYNRIDDLLTNLEIINNLWTGRNYPLFVVSNGIQSGFSIPPKVFDTAQVIELEKNPGHLSGAIELLQGGLERIPDLYEYIVTLEADTWVLSDRLVNRIIAKCERDPDIVWAAGNWVDKLHSVATDFAIIRFSFIKEHLDLLRFTSEDSIEACIYSEILRLNKRVMIIPEVYPTHLPRAMPWSVQARDRRRQVFPRAPMVTHHVEELPGGIAQKKRIANQTAGKKLFPDDRKSIVLHLCRIGYWLYELLLQITPKSRWFKGRKLKDRAES